MEISLSGYANDYVGKGMAGGKISIAPPVADVASPQRSTGFSMVGNTVLYGATGGQLFVNGRGGERFAVRNSGALGVVEGLGDHGCEYMTAGNIISLGSVGRFVALLGRASNSIIDPLCPHTSLLFSTLPLH